jgi:hypothetical protein
MGILDKNTYTLTCPSCGEKESAHLLDKGSGWNGSSWQNKASFSMFQTEWVGGGPEEPELKSATCNSCGIAPSIESSYGGY